MEITFAEMYSGIAGFRFGLEKANQISIDSESWFGSEEGQPSELSERRGIEERSSSGSRECIDSQQRIRNKEGQHEPFIEGGDGRIKQEFRCVWANDIDKYACQIYRKHYGTEELVEADIRTINLDTIPDFELLTAGFPCQSFSLAGKRRGFEDTRGTLFYEIARIASAKRPRLLLLENVKELLSNDEGRTFAKILQTLDDLGYLVEWQVLNSKHFGVPQNRERVFIVGHSRAKPTKQIFPVGSNGKKVAENRAVVRTLQGGGHSGGLHSRMTAISEKHCDTCICDQTDAVFNPNPEETDDHCETCTCNKNNAVIVSDRTRTYAGKGRNLESPKPHTNALSGVGKDNLVLLSHTKANIKQRSQNRNNSWTLDQTSSKMALIEGQRIRRLTPIECERLQGFPDGWTEGVSDTQRYKLLGNAVTTNVITYLSKHLSSLFYG